MNQKITIVEITKTMHSELKQESKETGVPIKTLVNYYIKTGRELKKFNYKLA